MQNIRTMQPSVVRTSTLPSMMVCFFRINEHNLSRVISIPWKFNKQLYPCTSSIQSLILRNALSSLMGEFRSAKDNSSTRPFRPSEAIFVPTVLVISVFPQFLFENILGASRLYHSFFWKGSTAFFRLPFLLFVNLLFFPTAIFENFSNSN